MSRRSGAPRVRKAPLHWRKDEKLPDHYVTGKIAKIKIVEKAPGLWKIIWVHFVVDEDDNFLERDELRGKTLRVVEE